MKFDLQLFDSGKLEPQNSTLYNAVVKQVEKDIFMSGMEIEPTQANEPEGILRWIHNFILESQRGSAQKLTNFLYRADIDEHLIQVASAHWEDLELPHVLSRLVFLRELAKVRLRQGQTDTN